MFWRRNAGIREWNQSQTVQAVRPNFMCLAKRFKAVSKISKLSKGLRLTVTLLLKVIQNLLTYAEGYEVRVSLYFVK